MKTLGLLIGFVLSLGAIGLCVWSGVLVFVEGERIVGRPALIMIAAHVMGCTAWAIAEDAKRL